MLKPPELGAHYKFGTKQFISTEVLVDIFLKKTNFSGPTFLELFKFFVYHIFGRGACYRMIEISERYNMTTLGGSCSSHSAQHIESKNPVCFSSFFFF
jgi:hypothetical protein